MVSAWSGASDGYDPNLDSLLNATGHEGYVGIFHASGPNWSGPGGLYANDFHGLLDPNESTTWSPIYIWATPEYVGDVMSLAWAPSTKDVPPADRLYILELLHVPPGVQGAPPVGTVWTLPLSGETLYELPVYRTTDPLSSYQFSFSMSSVTDPCEGYLLGDADCDGDVDFDDINPFIAALGGEQAWKSALGGSAPCLYGCANDINQDARVDFDDINPFIELLSG